MAKTATVGIAHLDADLGKPADYSREQLDLVKAMIRDIADQTMGGMAGIVRKGDRVLIKINTVISFLQMKASRRIRACSKR